MDQKQQPTTTTSPRGTQMTGNCSALRTRVIDTQTGEIKYGFCWGEENPAFRCAWDVFAALGCRASWLARFPRDDPAFVCSGGKLSAMVLQAMILVDDLSDLYEGDTLTQHRAEMARLRCGKIEYIDRCLRVVPICFTHKDLASPRYKVIAVGGSGAAAVTV